MYTLRSFIFLVVLSALASAGQAHSVTAVDGYLEQANAQQSLLSSQELESDEPESAVNSKALANSLLSHSNITHLSAPAVVGNYADFLARAPPISL